MKLSGAREARVDVDAQMSAALVYELTPPKRGRFEFGSIAIRFLSRWRLVWCQTRVDAPAAVKVYPNMRRAREVELRAIGHALVCAAARRKSQWRGEGREFESLRDYVRGDEMRHISWTATAAAAASHTAISDGARPDDSDHAGRRTFDDRAHRSDNETRLGGACSAGADSHAARSSNVRRPA